MVAAAAAAGMPAVFAGCKHVESWLAGLRIEHFVLQTWYCADCTRPTSAGRAVSVHHPPYLARCVEVLYRLCRKRYDAHGSEGLDVNYVDSAEFFTALFGSDRFEHLVRAEGHTAC